MTSYILIFLTCSSLQSSDQWPNTKRNKERLVKPEKTCGVKWKHASHIRPEGNYIEIISYCRKWRLTTEMNDTYIVPPTLTIMSYKCLKSTIPSHIPQYGLSLFLSPWCCIPPLSSPLSWRGHSSVSCWSNTSQMSQNLRIVYLGFVINSSSLGEWRCY